VLKLKLALALSCNKDCVDVLEDCVRTFVGINLSNFTEVSVVVDDRHRVVHVSIEALLEALHVVVSSTASRLTSLDAPLDAFVFGALEEQDEEEVHLLGHLSLPALQVVLVARKAIDQEFVVSSFLQRGEFRCIMNR
jgi:hypothetical protein